MKKINTLWFVLFFISLQAQAQLSGTYTIGVTGYYPTIQWAVTALNDNGISGPVNFKILNGTYDEQVTITDFYRAASAQTAIVTFSKNAPTDNVNWEYTSQGEFNNWIIRLDGAQYITIKGMTFNATNASYANIIRIGGVLDTNNNIIESNTFNGQTGTGNLITSPGGTNIYDHIIRNNTFNGGDYGISLNATVGIEILGNVFSDQYSRSISVVSQNTVIKGNNMSSSLLSWEFFISIVSRGVSPIIENNIIDQATGLSVISTTAGVSGTETRVVNNFLILRNSVSGSGVIFIGGDDNVSIYHNTVLSLSYATPALNIDFSNSDVRINNNILINNATSGGLSLRIEDGASISSSNNNNLYSSGTSLVKYETVVYDNLAEYSQVTGLDIDSVNEAVTFVNTVGTSDLHLATPSDNDPNLIAPALPSVTLDIDGDARAIYNVYKGADEGDTILPLDNSDTANGFYTIGGSNPDYTYFGVAIQDLKLRGMKGPVTFRVRPGTYPLQHTIRNITRFGSTDDLLLFRSSNINIKPVIRYVDITYGDNWVIKIKDMSDIEFRGFSFINSGPVGSGRILDIEGDSDNITLRNNIFNGIQSITSNDAALIFAADPNQDNFIIRNNEFINGSIALNMITPGSLTQPQGNTLIVESNTFDQQTVYALYSNHHNIDFNNNVVTSNANSVVAVLIKLNSGNQLNGNKFLLSGLNTTAISLWSADGSNLIGPGIISNNFILADTGIDFSLGAYLFNIYHNSIVSSILPINIQPYTNESNGINIQNNLLYNNNSGPAVFVATNATIDTSNYNDFYNTSGDLLEWQGSQYANLSDFQAATSFDANSTTTAVNFADLANADFHLTGASITDVNLSGTPLISVSTDYDGDIRSIAVPFMGADEAATSLTGSYPIGVNVSGLATTNSIQFRNNNTEDLIAISNGIFYFATEITDGNTYDVMITIAPTTPPQNCVVTAGSGAVSGAAVILDVACTTNQYFIGGTASGMVSLNTLIVQNNGSDDLNINDNGAFVFATAIDDWQSYNVSVKTLPNNPLQNCNITNGNGTVASSDVTDIVIDCVDIDLIFADGFE